MDATGFADLMDRAGDGRNALWGTTIVITDLSSVTHSFTAAAFYRPGGIDPVTGGYYNIKEIHAEIKTEDLSTFVPAPEMKATILGQSMRIAPDGVTPGIYNYRLRLVAEKSPSRPT